MGVSKVQYCFLHMDLHDAIDILLGLLLLRLLVSQSIVLSYQIEWVEAKIGKKQFQKQTTRFESLILLKY